MRLTGIGRELGLVGDQRWQIFEQKRDQLSREQSRLEALKVSPSSAAGRALATRLGIPLQHTETVSALLRRPQLDYPALMALPDLGPAVDDPEVAEQVQTQARYHGYVQRQSREVDRNRSQERAPLPDYDPGPSPPKSPPLAAILSILLPGASTRWARLEVGEEPFQIVLRNLAVHRLEEQAQPPGTWR